MSDAAGTHHVVSVDGVPLFADAHHLTTAGARLMLLPRLRETLPDGDGAHASATGDG